MSKKPLPTLLAVLTLAFAGASGALTAAPPAAGVEIEAPTLPAAPASGPVCTEVAGAEPTTVEALFPAGEVEELDSLASVGWYYGICIPNFCQRCYSDYDCTGGNTCQYGVQCP